MTQTFLQNLAHGVALSPTPLIPILLTKSLNRGEAGSMPHCWSTPDTFLIPHGWLWCTCNTHTHLPRVKEYKSVCLNFQEPPPPLLPALQQNRALACQLTLTSCPLLTRHWSSLPFLCLVRHFLTSFSCSPFLVLLVVLLLSSKVFLEKNFLTARQAMLGNWYVPGVLKRRLSDWTVQCWTLLVNLYSSEHRQHEVRGTLQFTNTTPLLIFLYQGNGFNGFLWGVLAGVLDYLLRLFR